MFRPLSHALKSMRRVPVHRSFIGLTLTTSIIQPRGLIKVARPPSFFTPNFPYTLKSYLRCQQCRKQALKWYVTNIVIHIHYAGFALYHWWSGKDYPALEIDYEESEVLEVDHEVSTVRHPNVPTFQSTLPTGFVYIDYAVDALFDAIHPDSPRLWCQQLILASLFQRLVVVGKGGVYICKKDRVDNMDWNYWWEHRNEDSDDGFDTPSSSEVSDDDSRNAVDTPSSSEESNNDPDD